MKRPGGFDRDQDPTDDVPPRRPVRPRVSTHLSRGAQSGVGDPPPQSRLQAQPQSQAERGSAPDLREEGPRTPAAGGDAADGPLAASPPETGVAGAKSGVTALVRRGGRANALRGSREARVDPVREAERRLRTAERQHRKSRRKETRRFTVSIRRARRQTLMIVGAVLALAAFVVAGAYTPLMSVRDVEVEGATHVNAEDVSGALQRFHGVPLALVDESEVLRALESFPLIQRFAVERVPPHTLRVRIEERVPAIAIEQDGVFRHYDAAGVLVGESSEQPVGIPLGAGGILNISSPAFHSSAKIVRDMPPGLREDLVSVTSSTGQDVTFTLVSGVEVFWGSTDETQKKALILQTMLSSLEGRSVSHVDVSSTTAPIFK